MKQHDCFNRKPFLVTVVVQSGWEYGTSDTGGLTRVPVMKTIVDPMSKGCKYSIEKPDDARCAGCSWNVTSKEGKVCESTV